MAAMEAAMVEARDKAAAEAREMEEQREVAVGAYTRPVLSST